MARSSSLQAAQKVAAAGEEDAAPQPTSQPQLRQRRRRPARQQPKAAAAAAAAAEAEEWVDPVDSMPRWVYYPRQYGGVALSAAACGCTAACYDQQDPLRVWKMLGWLGLALVALAVHELRPYRRMNYGDMAREQGIGLGRMLGF